MKRTLLFIAVLVFIAGCTQPPKTNTCGNGVLDAGEEAVDCGGVCDPCADATLTPTTPPTTTIEAPLCMDVEDAFSKSQCLVNRAFDENNLSLCDEVNEPFFKNICIRKIAVVSGDASLCGRVTDSFENNECLKGVALTDRNASYCASITDEANKDACYYSVATLVKDPATCNDISSESSKYRCLAITQKNPAACTAITAVKARDWCYQRYVELYFDHTLCNNVTDPVVKDRCFMAGALGAASESVCDLIGDGSLQAECKAQVKVEKQRRKDLVGGLSLRNADIPMGVEPSP